MRKWRRSAIPRDMQDYAAALARHPRHSDMLLATVTAGGGSAIILVMPNFGMCLRDSSTVIVDGTFQTVPAGLPACQILTIHGVIETCFFHPIIVVMQHRRRDLYDAVFQRIWQAAGNPSPAHVVTDYEPALQAALGAMTGVTVQGCFFHFVQALVLQLGLSVGRDAAGSRLVRLYAALAELRRVAADQQLPQSDDFHQYFVSHWMTRVTKLLSTR